MNGTFTQIWRIAWKDMRRIGGLWLALCLFWVACLCLGLVNSYFSSNFVFPFSIPQVLIGIMVTASVYALGWAGLTFATEHDDGTYGFLRALPVRPQQVFYGKVFFGVNSTILLIISLFSICLVHYLIVRSNGGQYVSQNTLQQFEAISLGAAITSIPLAIVIGLFWSLRLKRPLVALTVAGVCLPILTQACLLFGTILYPNTYGFPHKESMTGATIASGVLAAAVCALLYLLDKRLAIDWLPNHQAFVHSRTPNTAVPAVAARPSSWWRLIWLTSKQNLASCVVVGCFGMFLAAVTHDVDRFLPMLVAGMLGIIAFRPEHKEKRHRLLSQFSVGTNQYWFSRLLLPSLATLAIAVATPAFGNRSWLLWRLGGLFVAFSIGQFCSLAFSSQIIAIAVALLMMLVVSGWTWLCTVLGVHWWLTFGPPILLPLAATYLRVPRWFRQTNSWRQWVVPAIPLLLLFVGTPLMTAMYRIHEIPTVEIPDGLRLAPLSSEQQATIGQYEEVFSLIRQELELPRRVNPHQIDVVLGWILGSDWKPSEELLSKLMDATQGQIAFPTVPSVVHSTRGTGEGTDWVAPAILLAEASRAQDTGDSAKAWKYYACVLRMIRQRQNDHAGSLGFAAAKTVQQVVTPMLFDWSMRSETKPDQIDTAIAQLAKCDRDASQCLAGDFAMTDEWLEHPELVHRPNDLLTYAVAFAPWEITRSRRFRDQAYVTAYETRRRGAWSVPPSPDGQVYLGMWLTPQMFARRLAETEDVAIVRLAAVASYKRHGDYEQTRFNDERSLRTVPKNEEIPFSPYLCRKDATIVRSTSDNDHFEDQAGGWVTEKDWSDYDASLKRNRIYPLPVETDFEAWDAERFRVESNARTSAHERLLTDSTLVTLHGADSERYLEDAEEELMFAEDSDVIQELLSQLPAKRRSEITRDLLLKSLDSGNEDEPLAAMRVLMRQPNALEFLPQLLKLLSGDQFDKAAHVTFALNRWLAQHRPLLPQVKLLEPHLSQTPLDPRSLAIPIKNPANGHYYELIRYPGHGGYLSQWGNAALLTSWNDAERLAAKRSFKGMNGYLATVTSKDEHEFLERAFVAPLARKTYEPSPVSVWLGGQKSSLTNVWLWATGPELGEAFYGKGVDGFSDWADGEPVENESTAGYLSWVIGSNAPRTYTAGLFAQAPEEARDGSWHSDGLYDLSQPWYLVEYSPDEKAESKPKVEDARSSEVDSQPAVEPQGSVDDGDKKEPAVPVAELEAEADPAESSDDP